MTREEGVHLILVLVVLRHAELGVDILVFLEGIDDMLHAFLDNLTHGFRIIELWLLGQVAHAVAGSEDDIALVALVETGNDLQQR